MQDSKNIRDLDFAQIKKDILINPTEDIQNAEPVLVQQINGQDKVISTLGDFSLILGKAKSRKSFLMTILSAACTMSDSYFNFHNRLPKEKQNIVFFDTEQSKRHVQLLVQRVISIIGVEKPDYFNVYQLRKFDVHERLAIIENIILSTPFLGVVIIDGIRDLVTSINDEEQATMVTSKLLKWSEELNIHIYVVLHQNKSDFNARGHLGTELQNKAQTVLTVTKSESDKNISIVEPKECRDREPEPFAFEIINNLPVNVENFIVRTSSKQSVFDINDIEGAKYFSMLNSIFSRDVKLAYGKLVQQIKWQFNKDFKKQIGDNKCKQLLTHFKNNDWIKKEEGLKGKYTIGNYQ
ncbi:MAG: AAA family ATPase [Algicola sp.]|nr:AAA family ATPase [Algicola sp.]